MVKFKIYGFLVLLLLALGASGAGASVTLRIVAVNPSEIEPREVDVKSYLPKGTTRGDILQTDGMTIGYDDQREQYYVHKQVALEPQQSVSFTVELKDVWLIEPVVLEGLASRARDLTERLGKTRYAEQAQQLAGRIQDNVDSIRQHQELNLIPKVTPSEHIAAFHRNRIMHDVIRADVEMLEKLLSSVSAERLLEKLPRGIPPNIGTLWKVIFVIITFLGVTSAVFFFIWSRQLRKIREAEALPGGSVE